MKNSLILLEVGNLGGIVVMIFAIIGIGAFVLSLIVAGIYKLIYEFKGTKKLSKSQFWQVVLVCLFICGLITGMICM
ncbi:hypothetical protein G6R40_10350 [Chryseobacterium sp. POL2]|uniref:hypothetical protein n=1 Tax=Chryseobacterium sp. POL2 TaxID=2713414 RepID=UPI0013E184CA|nr:hypothetical protein [Chryseobacterium sp. POL2]QIG90037.1 hypothetical protein G6R40_10350 [Chryseobacterium sp. POL2]